MRRFVSWGVKALGFVAVCAAMFDVCSALVIERGHSAWLALAVGLAVFPVAPIAWHLASSARGWRELSRRTLWVGLIAAIAIGALARSHVKSVVRDHLLWWMPGRTTWIGEPSLEASCEAFATMEEKCAHDELGTNHEGLTKLCKVASDFEHDVDGLVAKASVAARCAVATSSCDAYEACQGIR